MQFGGADKSLHMEHELKGWMWSYTSGKNSKQNYIHSDDVIISQRQSSSLLELLLRAMKKA